MGDVAQDYHSICIMFLDRSTGPILDLVTHVNIRYDQKAQTYHLRLGTENRQIIFQMIMMFP
jgi:hypothetical protein